METILIKLMKLENSPEYSVDNILSKKLISNFLKGIFEGQQDLAKELFISESAITKFCQKLSYAGFREFQERFKLEYEKYVLSEKQSLDSDSFIKKILFSLNDINTHSSFFNLFKKTVVEKNGLFIFPSYQSENSALFLRDYLVDQGIEAKCFNSAKNGIWNIEKYFNQDYPILMIFTGPDNGWLRRFYQELKKAKKNIFLVVSSAQEVHFADNSQKFVLTSYFKYSSFYYRKIILELIFLSIFEQ